MKEITVPADKKQLNVVLDFLREIWENNDCSPKNSMQLELVTEEIFVNVASYAYKEKEGRKEEGNVTVKCDVLKNDSGKEVIIEFVDSGIEYNPLKKEDPNIKLSAEDRPIGGLGIFLTKKLVDKLDYFYENGKNILRLKKII